MKTDNKVTTVNYTRDEILRIYANMKKYGGGFISALSEAIIKADQENLKKLQNAFPDEFEKYLKIGGAVKTEYGEGFLLNKRDKEQEFIIINNPNKLGKTWIKTHNGCNIGTFNADEFTYT